MDFDKYKVQTDLAIEAREMVREEQDVEIEGVKVDTYETEDNSIKITRVDIFNEAGSERMGKPEGKYVTIESKYMKENDIEMNKKISSNLSDQLEKIHPITKDSKVLVVGLGNWNVTADSLGPKVVSKTIVTRHLFEHLEEDISDTFGCTSAFVPGVMGLTGIETSEIVKGMVEKVEPNLVIVIDALAARNTNRVNTTIQITDVGIHPGSGVGNKRNEISEKTIGAPVVAIGVPTVVNAITLVSDVVDKIQKIVADDVQMTKEQKNNFIEEILNPDFQELCVTPKEEDTVVRTLRNIISNGLNVYMHKGINIDEVKEYVG